MNAAQIVVTTPEHYEVAITLEDTTTRRYLVVAPDEAAAVAYVEGLHNEGRIVRTKLVQEHRQRFAEVTRQPW